ncbi:DsbA family protein [Pseudomonas turukhanskensis]|nr:thioredoxin domain-containing protein [Pseudomonas turukhanskensis]
MSRRATVLSVLILAVVGFAAAAYFYRATVEKPMPQVPAQTVGNLVRFHSPTFGPANAPVTVVEFFDPSCESCRAFYPIVKDMMAKNPGSVRLVLRYVLLHPGSEQAVRLLEASRQQGVFPQVLEAVLEAQPGWHDDPQIVKAWAAAEAAGLDVQKAREQMVSAKIDAVLAQDAADAKAAGVQGTPTFFVNGKPLPEFGAQPLYDLIKSEMAQAK